MAAITQMTRFKSDKTEEMVKNARAAKVIFEKHGAFGCPVSTPACGPESGWLLRATPVGKHMARRSRD